MATTHLIGFLQSGLVTSAGVAIASGKVRFYQPGTLTPETVYSDGAGVTPLAQPVTLSAGGTATVYSLNPIRCIVKDATDVSTLFDLDQADTVSGVGTSIQSATFNNNVAFNVKAAFDAWSTSFGGTAGMWKGKIGTTERNVKDMISGIAISVIDYGAVGDDSTDCTTAIQNTINAVVALGGGTIVIPPGTFRITSSLTTSGSVPLRFTGAGATSSMIKQMGAAANTLTASATTGLSLVDIGLNASATTGTAIVVPATVTSLVLTNVAITGHAVGVTGIGDGFGTGAGTLIRATASLSNVVVVMSAGAGVCISGTFDNTSFVNVFLAPTGATAMLFTASSAAVESSFSALGGVIRGGITIPASSVAFITFAGTTGTVAMAVAAGCTARISRTGYRASNDADSRTGAPVAIALAGSLAITPVCGIPMRIIQATAATTVTVQVPLTPIAGERVSLMCINNSGGAVTWSFTATYRLSVAVAPATGNCTSIEFIYDHISAVFREATRATAAI